MPELPKRSVLVRTWFGQAASWDSLVAAVTTENEDGFLADVVLVNDTSFEGLTASGLQAATAGAAAVSFLADEQTLTSRGYPILAVPVLFAQAENVPQHQPFRVTAGQLWSVENNLNIANMDWIDFADAVDDDGVFRGFPDGETNSGPPPSTRLQQLGLAASRRILTAMAVGIAGRDDRLRADIHAERLLRTGPAGAYELAAHMSFWMTHGAISYPIEIGGAYQITSGGSSHERASLFGYLGAIRGHYRRLEPDRLVEMTWNWYAPPPAGTSPLTVSSYLGWETVVRWTISASNGPGQTLVSVEHLQAPAEWAGDLGDFWDWNLEHMQEVLDVKEQLRRRRPRR